MNRLMTIAIASTLALGAISAGAADSAADERSELRQRAEAFQAERARNPDFQPGEGRLNAQRSDVQPKRDRQARLVRNKPAKTAAKETRREKAAKRVRSLKKIPGAFVR